MLLDKNNRVVQVQLGEGKVTNDLMITTEYDDTIREAITTETIFTASNGVTLTNILAAPQDNTERRVIEIHIYNADTVVHQVQISLLHDATSQIIQNVSLNPGDTLHYNRFYGWSVQFGGPTAGLLMKKYRLTTINTSVLLTDEIIDVDASGGVRTITFNPAIVTVAGFAKEVKISKIDTSINNVNISDGVSTIAVLTLADPVKEMYAPQGGVLEVS